jgi:acyl-CoA reductase-like NAD-dependent aldehyde dehydrogenase
MNRILPAVVSAGTPSAAGDAQKISFDLEQARVAQVAWRATPIAHRLSLLRELRSLLATHAGRLATLAAELRRRPVAEVLTSEVAPLLEACRFLERNTASILAPRKLGAKGRPLWLHGVQAEIHREPLGLVLVIGPSNYPLFLPGSQALQALAAGNAVVLKPAPGGGAVLTVFAEMVRHSGVDHRLVQVLPEPVEAVKTAIACGVDKVVLTGSAETGAAVLSQLAGHLTPAVVELSGCDAVFVREDADLDHVVRCLAFGLRLNQGATCIAPRRVLVHHSLATELEGRLATAFADATERRSWVQLKPAWQAMIQEALAAGAHLVSGTLDERGVCAPPLVLAGASPAMRLLQSDVFAPVMSLVVVSGDAEALDQDRRCPYALGATVFGRDLHAARRLAGAVRAGVVVVNDMIVPTADPRLPFGGLGRSGFGATRGAEGLLEMTAPKAIAVRHAGPMPHLDPAQPGDELFFQQFLLTAHARGWRDRWRAGLKLLKLASTRRKHMSATARHPGTSSPQRGSTEG